MTHGDDLINFSLDSIKANGLTKREYFAAMAMQGLLSNPMWMTVYKGERYLMEDKIAAEVSTSYSDALINALNEKP